MSSDTDLPKEPLPEETSTLAIHETAMDESVDPEEAFDAGPAWFWYFTVAALVIGGFYLGRHMGDYSTVAHVGFIDLGKPMASAADSNDKAKSSVSGASVYGSRCSTCHQADGKGVPGAFPPLVGSPFVLGDPEVTVKILLHGLHGPIEVEGKQFNGVMPAWADQLSNAEIAAVASHIRTELGSNKAQPVEEDLVDKLKEATAGRTTPWTAEELGNPGEGK